MRQALNGFTWNICTTTECDSGHIGAAAAARVFVYIHVVVPTGGAFGSFVSVIFTLFKKNTENMLH